MALSVKYKNIASLLLILKQTVVYGSVCPPPYEWAYCSRTIESIVFLLYLENNGDHVTGSFPLMC